MTKTNELNVNALLRSVDRMRGNIARTLSDLLQFNTENPPVEDYEIQRYIGEELNRSGLKARFHHPGDKAVALTSSFGDDNDGLILYGHVDVVPSGDRSKWKYPPYSGKIVDDRIYGRGASDMKSGVAALLYAYKLLYENNARISGRLEFVTVLDEENWHKTPKGWNTSDWLLRTDRLRGKACLMGEPSGVSRICIGERGDYWIRMRSRGEPTHGSRPIYGDNACVNLFQCFDEINRAIQTKVSPPREIGPVIKRSYRIVGEDLRSSTRPSKERILEKYSMNVGVVSGGTMINMVPENCQADVAFCIPLGSTREILDKKIRDILRSPRFRGISMDYLGESQSNPTYTSPETRIVTTTRKAVRRITDKYPSIYVTQGTSDANVFRKHRIDTCFYGPGTFETIHGYNEFASIRDTVTAVKVYLLAIAEYFKLETDHN